MGNWFNDLWKKVELFINLILVHGRKALLDFGNGLRICKHTVNCISFICKISLSSLLTVSEQDRVFFVYSYIPSTWHRAGDQFFMKIDTYGKSKVYFSWKQRRGQRLNLHS